MNNNNAAGYGSVGLAGILGIVFIVLKLCNVINWSWWWVTCPFWIPIAVVALILIVALAVSVVRHLLSKRKYRRYPQ